MSLDTPPSGQFAFVNPYFGEPAFTEPTAPILSTLLVGFNNDTDTPPGSIPAQTQNQLNLIAQLIISLSVGLLCFLTFCVLRTRVSWLYAPRLNMKRHAPDRLPESFFGWVIPLIRTPHSVVLEKVGLDAVVMLQFFVMAIKLFAFCSFFGVVVLIPVGIAGGDLTTNGTNPTSPTIFPAAVALGPKYLIVYLVFTYVFSFATYYFMFENYRDYVRMRRRYCIRLAKSVPARTVMVHGIPPHLRSDQKLAEYYEGLGIGSVESSHVVRHVSKLGMLVVERAKILDKLERAYTEYWGNPCSDPAYDPDAIIAEMEVEPGSALSPRGPSEESHTALLPIATKRKQRPTIRTGLFGVFGKKVDAIDYWTQRFNELDDEAVKARTSRAYEVTTVGFVTFEGMQSATVATQVLLAAEPFQLRTLRAPEPRDVYWPNITISGREQFIRDVFVNIILFFLVFFWAVPVGFLSTLTSIETIQKYLPWLLDLAEKNVMLRSIIQGFVPTIAVVIFMNVLPLVLEGLCYVQGQQARSTIEESTMSKYFFFLLFNVLLIFTIARTLLATIGTLWTSPPTEIVNILATNLPKVAPFFINYTILQGMALIPVELLLLGIVGTNVWARITARTPREYANVRAPWSFNYGFMYPQPMLIFIIVLVYSTISPLILVFGTIYFASCYVVYKYQLLFVYFHPYESAGRAWPIIFPRLIAGMIIFQITMAGLFLLKRDITLGILCGPLVFITIAYKYFIDAAYDESSKHLPLETLREELGKAGGEVANVAPQNAPDPGKIIAAESANAAKAKPPPKPAGNSDVKPTTSLASRLQLDKIFRATTLAVVAENRVRDPSRIKRKRRRPRVVLDDDDYQATSDEYTDFEQPPMSLFFGILNTGMRRYGNPALIGVLPQLWLPVKKSDKPKSAPGKAPANGANGANGANTIAARNISLSAGPSSIGSTAMPLAGTTVPVVPAQPTGGAPEPVPAGQLPEHVAPVANPGELLTLVGDTHESSVEQGFMSGEQLPGDDGAGEAPSSAPGEGSAQAAGAAAAGAATSPVEEEMEDEDEEGVHGVYYHHPERRGSITNADEQH